LKTVNLLYISSIIVVVMKKTTSNIKPFHIQKGEYGDTHVHSAPILREPAVAWVSASGSTWADNVLKRVKLIREGLPFEAIEDLSKKINIPIKSILSIVGMPQTTYNKKKNERSLLDSHNTELVLLIRELVDYGVDVFNGEEQKFQRWLKKNNLSLGGHSPESLLDTVTGIQEVRACLDRLEYGVLA